jgi:polysaccharide export outer membrane protein
MRLFITIVGLIALCQAASAQEASYALQSGDTVEVSVLQDPTLNRRVVIGPDGNISFPLAGHIKASGLTTEALEKTLAKRLSKNYQTPPQVTVMLSGTNENSESKIYVTGEVNKPGPYPASPGTSVMQAIALSGGLGRFAATSRIQIHRRVAGKDQVFLFDYDAFQSGTNPEGDIPLQAGDVIVVPEKGLFR